MTTDQPVSLVMVVTAFGGIIILLLGAVFSIFGRWMKGWGDGLKDEIRELCESNQREHAAMGNKIDHHGHRIKAANGGYETAGVLTPESGR